MIPSRLPPALRSLLNELGFVHHEKYLYKNEELLQWVYVREDHVCTPKSKKKIRFNTKRMFKATGMNAPLFASREVPYDDCVETLKDFLEDHGIPVTTMLRLKRLQALIAE